MTQTFAQIKAALKAKVEGLLAGDSNPLFAEVQTYAASEFAKYPAATIVMRAGSGAIIDTNRHERTYTFDLNLIAPQFPESVTKQEASDLLTDCIDRVMQAFDTDTNLGEAVARVKVVPVLLDSTPRPQNFVFATFTLECVDFVPNR